MRLADYVYDKIEQLSKEGNGLLDDQGRWRDAIAVWSRALGLLPDPKRDWEAATWLYASIGEAYYQGAQYEDAKHSLFEALNCPGGLGTGFIHYRLGECQLELGEEDPAVESFLKAYMLEGEDIFKEDGDRGQHYLDLLSRHNLL